MKWKFGDYITPNERPTFPEFHFFLKSINISFHIEEAYFKSPVLLMFNFKAPSTHCALHFNWLRIAFFAITAFSFLNVLKGSWSHSLTGSLGVQTSESEL